MDDQQTHSIYEEYVAKYGRDNADYLMEVMGAWQKHYSRAAYIENAEMPMPDYREDVREIAGRRSWRFEQLEGRLLLVRDLIEGHWEDDNFLVVPPGMVVLPTNDARIVCAGPAQ